MEMKFVCLFVCLFFCNKTFDLVCFLHFSGVIAGADQAAVTSQLKDSANLATTWYDSNLLAGNLKKYQVLNLGFTQNDSNICVNDVVIETKDNIILLGVVLDSKLNFSEHIISICKKASQRIGVLMRLRNLISKLILFKSAILPFLTYCHLVWHFCKASDTRKLERLQERGLRAVFKGESIVLTVLPSKRLLFLLMK